MADFGDPSTWEMNVDQFIDSGLPKEKPQELLDLQEQNRKQRLLQSLQKIGPRLEDSSLDFINRENFAKKGIAKIRPTGLDSTRSKTGLDRMSDLLLKAYAEDDILHLANMPKRDTMNLSYFLAREDNIKYLSKKSGLSTEDIFDLLDDRAAYLELEKRSISQTAGAETRLKPQREFYRKAEDWITKNAKRYDDPGKFKKAFKRTFPKNNLLLDAINSNKESLNVQFSDSFKSEMFGTGKGLTLGGRSKKPVEVTSKIKDLSIPRRSVDAVFKTAIYNLNPTVRNKLLNEFKNIVPKNKPSNKDLYNIKQSIRNNKLFKKFGVEKSIKGPIARLLYKDLGEDVSKQISALRQPRLQTTNLLRVFRDLVDPKYKNQFTEALSAVESANRKDIPEAKAKLDLAENINFDHKIPKSFIDAGYADDINYIKLNPTLESFNQGAKLDEFDRPMLAKARRYEAASKQEKPKILKEMQDIQSNFNERYSNYLSNVTIKDVKGKPYFESTDLPLTKETNVKKLIKENIKFKPDGPTLGMNAIAPAKAAELVDFTQLPKDFKNVSDEMIKPLVDKGKIFGKKSAKQILSMTRPAAKLTGLELLFGSAFAPLDIGEGRPMKDVALNVATLGLGVPIKDARRAAAFADKYGLKEDLFTAKMKLAGANKIRGNQKIEFTDKEQEALRAETYFKEKILQPELDQLLEERQSESDPNFGLTDMGMAEGGRISFGSGSGPMPVRIIYLIMDRLRNLKNSTFSNYNQVRMYGEQKGITELLEPYKNIPNKNRVTSAIDDAEELKKFMPDEYKPILDEIIDDTKQFKFKTAHDKQQALEKVLPEELKFENLPEEMFPMPNPENPNFIMPYGYPDKNPFQKSRITMRTEADKFTGKGTRKTYDTFNEETKQYQEPSKNTLISEEPIDEELESIIRDLDKGDLQ